MSDPRIRSGLGGLRVSKEMQDILQIPGFIRNEHGGLKLRQLYQKEYANIDLELLSVFARCCYYGYLAVVIQAVQTGAAPNLADTESPFRFGYALLTVVGAQRTRSGQQHKHADVLKYLLSRGIPPDVEDIVGYTALHHALLPPNVRIDLARILLEGNANVNYQNRYGEAPLLTSCQINQIPSIELLMDFGADMDLPEAHGLSVHEFNITWSPQVAAVVAKGIRKRNGEIALMDEKKCDNDRCPLQDSSVVKLRLCTRCRSVRYHSTECQREHWKIHKLVCQPFSDENTVTLKPFYHDNANVTIYPRAYLLRQSMNIPTEPVLDSQHIARMPASKSSDFIGKPIIVKVQVPLKSQSAIANGDILIHTKKRGFSCYVRKVDNPEAYDRLSLVINNRGYMGAKAYFTAELKSKDELVVKVSEVLAEQPF